LSCAPLKETNQRDNARCASGSNPLRNVHPAPGIASEAKRIMGVCAPSQRRRAHG
jgi:hypothetical protein